jgi:WD40 repeat protein
VTAADQPDAQRLAVATADGTVTLWDPAGRAAPAYPVHTGKITAAAGTGGGVVAGGYDGSVMRWDAWQRRTTWSVAAHRGPVTALCHLPGPDGDLVASAGADQTLRIWDARTGALRFSWRNPSGTVEVLAGLTLRGVAVLVSADADGTVRLWDPATGRQRGALPGRSARVRDLCPVAVGGRVLLASVGDAAVRLWDPEAHDRRETGSVRSGQVTAVTPVWKGSRQMVASGLGDGQVELRHLSTGMVAGSLTGHGRPVTGLSTVAAAGEVMLASSSAGDSVRMWTLGESRRWPWRSAPAGWSSVVAAVYLNWQVYLACAGEAGTIRLFDPQSGRERRRRHLPWRRPDGHTGAIGALCAVPGRAGARLASAGHDGAVRIWDLETGRTEVVFDGHKGRVRTVCGFSAGGLDLMASAGDDQLIRIWDAATGTAHLSLAGHTGRITAVCPVTAGGRLLLASAGTDRTARLWNPVTGGLELTVPVHHEATSCTASADYLIIGLTAGTLALSLNV